MTPDRLRDASRRRRSADLHQGSAAFRGGVAAARSLAVERGHYGSVWRVGSAPGDPDSGRGPRTGSDDGLFGDSDQPQDWPRFWSYATEARPRCSPRVTGRFGWDFSKSVRTLSGPGTFPPHGFGGGSACHRRAVSLHRPQRLGVFGRRTLSGRGSWWSAYFDSVPAAGRCTPPGRHSVPGRRSLALEASIRERQRGKLRARGTAPGPSPRQEQWTYGFGGIPC